MKLHADGISHGLSTAVIGILTTQPIGDEDQRSDYIAYSADGLFAAFGEGFDGYAAALTPNRTTDIGRGARVPVVYGASSLEYLTDGDVVWMRPPGRVSVLYRRQSPHNTLLTTERCNSLCLMCSQPPKDVDDSYRVTNILRLLELIDTDCHEPMISGGEPTLLGDDFFRIIEKAKHRLPTTALHVLSNGRLFEKSEMARRLGSLQHPDLMLGIPLYSDIDYEHDFVVQAAGAFDQTLHGLYNLAEAGVAIEIRVVVHALTHRRLPQLAEFIYRNLPFVAHVALMGLEMFGYVHQNMDQLWIDPVDYSDSLRQATLTLALRRIPVSIYNHQLCTIPRELWQFSRKSISDWKNLYLEPCEKCEVKDSCAGFFQSAVKRHSAHIVPIRNEQAPASTTP